MPTSPERRVPWSRMVAGLLVVQLTAACTSGDASQDGDDMASPERIAALLLEQDQVPGATAARDVEQLEQTAYCTTVVSTERDLRRQADGRTAVREFTVPGPAGEVVVETAVFELDRTTAAQDLLTQLRTFSGDCIAVDPATPLGNDESNGVFSPLPGTPADAVGYALAVGGTRGGGERTRAYAVVGSTLVVVGARSEGPLEVAVPDLLAAAVARVEAAGEPA